MFVQIGIVLFVLIVLYFFFIRPRYRVVYEPTKEVPTVPASVVSPSEKLLGDKSEKQKMFETYFPPVKEGITMDYPLKPIGCCPPSKEMSKDLPVANIPICYAKESKTHLR